MTSNAIVPPRAQQRPPHRQPMPLRFLAALRFLLVPLVPLALGACGDIVPVAPDAFPGNMNGSSDSGFPIDRALAPSFEIVSTLTYDVPLPGLLPREHRFVLHLDDQEGETRAIAGTRGQVITTRFVRSNDGTRQLDAPFALRAPTGELSCELGDIVYQQLHLTARDTDGDGAVDRLEGRASGYITVTGVDVLTTFQAQIEGALDRTPPDIVIPGTALAHHVMDPVQVYATEPLAADPMLVLMRNDGAQIELHPATEDAPAVVARFSSPEGGLLPFGATLRIEASAPLRDLAGLDNQTALPRELRLMPDPGTFAEDGFEGPQNIALQGDTKVIGGTATLPAISQQRSLYVGMGGRATVRIPLQAGDTQVSLFLRGLYPSKSPDPIPGIIEIGAPGAQQIVRVPVSSASTTQLTETGDPDWPYAGPITFRAIALPAGATGSVVVSIHMPASLSCADLGVQGTAILVDELRVEASSFEPGPDPVPVSTAAP